MSRTGRWTTSIGFRASRIDCRMSRIGWWTISIGCRTMLKNVKMPKSLHLNAQACLVCAWDEDDHNVCKLFHSTYLLESQISV
jgi:hypothetical protein